MKSFKKNLYFSLCVMIQLSSIPKTFSSVANHCWGCYIILGNGGPTASTKKKLISEGKLSKHGKPNEKTPAEWLRNVVLPTGGDLAVASLATAPVAEPAVEAVEVKVVSEKKKKKKHKDGEEGDEGCKRNRVRLYDASANMLRGEFLHGDPVLDCCFHDDTSGFSASADNTVRRLVFDNEREDILGRHDAPVRCIKYSYATGYALSSVEGRVAMEFFELTEAGQSKKYAFKCHRKSEAGRDIVYLVNAVAFHPLYGTFATSGCDGFVNVWDGNNKKRLYQYPKYPTSVGALSFSRDGRLLAVTSSYTYEEGEKPHEPDAIYVRSVNEVEVKPKPKVYPNAAS